MKSPAPGPWRPGRPRSNPLPRTEQLRLAKRAQRDRDRNAGLVLSQFKLRAPTAKRMRQAMAIPGFEAELGALLDEAIVEVRRYPNLRLLCWNRTEPILTARDAFALYERNWRFVDTKNLGEDERRLIEKLTRKYGNGVLNV
jgi:hypothetical protein